MEKHEINISNLKQFLYEKIRELENNLKTSNMRKKDLEDTFKQIANSLDKEGQIELVIDDKSYKLMLIRDTEL